MSALYGLRHDQEDDDDDVDSRWVSHVITAPLAASIVSGPQSSDEDEDDDEGSWASSVTTAVIVPFVTGTWAEDDEDDEDGSWTAVVADAVIVSSIVSATWATEDEDEEDGNWSAGIVDAVALVPDIFGFQQESDDPDEDATEQFAQATPDLNDFVSCVQTEANDPDDDEPEQVAQVTPGLNDYVASAFDADDEADEDDDTWADAKIAALFVIDEPAKIHGFEIGGTKSVHHKPLLQRIIENRTKPIPPPKSRSARKRVKAIEVKAAELVLHGGGEDKFRELMKEWIAAKPAIPQAPQIDAYALFMAQVAFRLRQIEQDDEEALLLFA